MRNPSFITFTGVDDETPIKGLLALSNLYPIEWGVLFSPGRQGSENRYPSTSFIDELRSMPGLRLAAHLCGDYARAVCAEGATHAERHLPGFQRVQVNVAEAQQNVTNCQAFAERRGGSVILQARGDEFPTDAQVSWLYDRSGGRGEVPKQWPSHPGERLVGYAGGLKPTNVVEIVEAISAAGPYWIDMESGVRDQNDRFSLDLCRAVCQAVFGD